ncbi:hypothetical protein [Streptomyces noursei]|uniref:hypothetical protein n=1 Tax=Streptomyces noursei TaxID=1971 RepID=UPI0019635095|nr:hypothetical protein [Streptomyces noursei]QRX95534.1 hypothetical protein JNO44_36335 [Streptomyces noursei]
MERLVVQVEPGEPLVVAEVVQRDGHHRDEPAVQHGSKCLAMGSPAGGSGAVEEVKGGPTGDACHLNPARDLNCVDFAQCSATSSTMRPRALRADR